MVHSLFDFIFHATRDVIKQLSLELQSVENAFVKKLENIVSQTSAQEVGPVTQVIVLLCYLANN